MLCRKMRLTERHIQPPREPNEGPIIRPCTARKLDGNEKDSALFSVGHHGRKPTKTTKTPLVIVNLNIPPGTQTLAPKNVKSSRKLPPFCVQHQHLAKAYGSNQSHSSPEETPVFSNTSIPHIFIQGYEIHDKKIIPLKPRDIRDCEIRPITENEEDSFANILLDNISNISLEMLNRHQQRLLGTSKVTKTVNKGYDTNCETFLNLDSYEMDDYGHGSPDKLNESGDPPPIPTGYRSLCYRTPSPSTRQIIRVNVTMNRDRGNNESFRLNH
ncbi:uncharacterized protein LOC129775986 [Toxorhynchites rutilus septentrionalis]|uniref:uncharacterized protein LOC129775986 n=1 Tax=Toxorhynchites rutilus septentrionalis TaxID=329112 RepID=UPI00247A4A58|nr:uncharacterized protein LOC129775986 [Toxorhynchites rutilus septentrionalis]XP_055637275.1 uncharacterized protein LOC129775986 [Toxorhynchites rutilus septentrionalis]XP_055637276.1 uncharacterized protein LOC129775986 [Toxorhynchites rutilus septentrionalis]XP_055637277.1 uncharacterized protein LOC129775986 [Toxorhynchites rutilus septentrionalis]XP_055637278.1 uncharacterized protein LOC129775986 [Toxorhynchites rutilus septentrionalis]XP_055637280.1 uncharacterized protein LOC12977598